MAKKIKVSTDGLTWYTLPGRGGSISNEAGTLDDTILGQDFASSFPGLINSTMDSNAIVKGFAGYVADVMQTGLPTAFTDIPASLVSGKTYQVDDATKQIWDPDTAVVISVGGVDVTNQVSTLDYLYGKVTFKATYTVVGAVTVSGKFLTTTIIGGYKSYSLTQSAEAIDNTDCPTAKGNGGRTTYEYGLKNVSLSVDGIFTAANGLRTKLEARALLVVEINPDGNGQSAARGFYRYTSQGQQGDVGALEEENVSLTLSVPDNELLSTPFAWNHAANTKLSPAIVLCLNAYERKDKIFMQYLPNGVTGIQADAAVITDLSIGGGLDNMNDFTISTQISGTLTDV